MQISPSSRSGPRKLPVGAIDAAHVWKRFRADLVRPLFRDHIERFQDRLLGRKGDDERGWTWVLRDVSLHVEPGESLALLGLNGSGKTTLLKILSQIMYPNSGKVRVEGRLGSIIEVRSGIHPDLTGRENVYFYGSILGLPRREVAAKFDTIIEFAELEEAVDRQVKYYSSGMQMRLGFSIAAFLEPDILMVDEVLAVGDLGFQQRCLERMRTVLNQGTTLVFVSHDLAAVESMCSSAMWLDRAHVMAEGPVQDVIHAYRSGLKEKASRVAKELDDPVRLVGFSAKGGADGTEGIDENVMSGGPLDVVLTLESDAPYRCDLCLGVTQGPAAPIFVVKHLYDVPKGQSGVHCRIDSLPLPRSRYFLWAGAFGENGEPVMSWHPVTGIDVHGPSKDQLPKGILALSPVRVRTRWSRVDPEPRTLQQDVSDDLGATQTIISA